MANGKTHLVVGAADGLTVALADKKKLEVSHPPSTGLALGASFGKLPDFLEPSLGNPHHRQSCHSSLVLATLGIELKQLFHWYPENGVQKCIRGLCLIAGFSYFSHLLCYAETPQSLPLLGKV